MSCCCVAAGLVALASDAGVVFECRKVRAMVSSKRQAVAVATPSSHQRQVERVDWMRWSRRVVRTRARRLGEA